MTQDVNDLGIIAANHAAISGEARVGGHSNTLGLGVNQAVWLLPAALYIKIKYGLAAGTGH